MIDIRNIDCMELMKATPDKAYDIAIVDPEYGRNESGGVNRSRYVLQKNGDRKFVGGDRYQRKHWDQKPPGDAYFDEVFRVSKHQIIWGCNYYSRNFGPGRIVWDKINDGSDQSDCELAYNSQSELVNVFRFMWRGMMQGSPEDGTKMQGNKKLNEKRIHPTQKPVALYKYLLKNWVQPGWKILDTHLGSGSIAIACDEFGFDLVGTELDADYFKAAEQRLRLHQSQHKLFV